MKKLSEVKGENAIDVLAELLEPCVEIMADAEVAEQVQNQTPRLLLVKTILKKHKESIIQILCIVNDIEKDEINLLTLPKMVIELMNDEEVMNLFQSQGQNTLDGHFGSAMESTTETEEM